jgi:ammonium transporter, Amt family
VVGYDSDWFLLWHVDDKMAAFFVFQAAFCGTAATIVSGAVAARMRLSVYLILIVVISALIYPVFGHWAWGKAFYPDNGVFLGNWGFVDFAGSTVVHSCGAWVALVGVLMIGPRVGKFDENGKPIQISGHNPVMATTGAMILWIGWIGFNGGSTLIGSVAFSHIVSNTMLAGAFGGLIAMILGRWKDGIFRPDASVNGVLAGLVAITAGCNAVTSLGAVLIGIGGGLATHYGKSLLERWKIDDVVGAIPVHGFAGVWGTIGLALVAPMKDLPNDSRLLQIAVQCAGVLTCFVFTVATAYVALRIIRSFISLRVSPEDEIAGLNWAEHRTRMGLGELHEAMSRLVSGHASLSDRLTVEPGDEASDLAALFNRLMTNLEADEVRHVMVEEQRRLEDRRRAAREKMTEDQLHREREEQAAQKSQRMEQELAERNSEREAVAEISAIIQRITSGDLSQRLPIREKIGALHSVSAGVNSLLDHLSHMVGGIVRTVEGIQAATPQLSQGSDALAERSEAQRRAVGQLRVGMTAVSDMLSDSTHRAGIAVGKVAEAKAVAMAGTSATDATLAAMNNITDAAGKVTKILDVINEITSQTNSLAINAAIEAARAGGHGQQFAVVASEIRALSKRTKQFSDEIASIIKSTQDAVQNGAKAVDQTCETLTHIQNAAEHAALVVEEILDASQRQADHIEALSTAVEQINVLSENNSELSQASADSAKELMRESHELYELVPKFSTQTGR